MSIREQAPHDSPTTQPHAPATLFHVGTLTYTKAGLFTLFGWLLWGDVCYQIMEQVPGLVVLKFKALDAPDWLMAVMMSTIPMLMSATINPWVSFMSDRHRGKLGRRMPFILYTAPFLTISLIAIGFSDPLGHILHQLLAAAHISLSQRVVTLGIIGVFVTMFAFFNMFVGSVFWYLFNDVVPQAVMARFTASFSMASTGAISFYSFFIFPHAQTHLAWIFLGAGLLYLVTFTAMCLRVKEGEYPPPSANVDGGTGLLSGIKTFGRECFSHRFYWYCYGFSGLSNVGGTIYMFGLFLQMQMGLTLGQIGMLGGVSGIWNFVLLYFAGRLADRYHPMRTWMVSNTINTLVFSPIGLLWLFFNPSPQTYFYICLTLTILQAPVNVLGSVSSLPTQMRLFPKEYFGQFCSANACVRSVLCMFGGICAGIFMSIMKGVYHGNDYHYRYMPVWSVTFGFLGYISFCLWYREWKRLGGVESFTPPEVGPKPASQK